MGDKVGELGWVWVVKGFFVCCVRKFVVYFVGIWVLVEVVKRGSDFFR